MRVHSDGSHLSCGCFGRVWGGLVHDLFRRTYCGGARTDSNKRMPVRGADRSRRSGVGRQAGVAAACPPPPPLPRWPRILPLAGRPAIWTVKISGAGGGREIRHRKPRLHLRRSTGIGEVGGRKGHRCCLVSPVHGLACGARERDKRGRSLRFGARGPGNVPRGGRTRRAVEQAAEAD